MPLIHYTKPSSAVAQITLNRPEALNAINLAMCDELWDYIHAALIDPDVRALIFAGAGPALSLPAPTSPSSAARPPCTTPARRDAAAGEPGDFFRPLAELPQPTIAVIRGDCLGGGLDLAPAADIRIGAVQIGLGFPELLDPQGRVLPCRWVTAAGPRCVALPRGSACARERRRPRRGRSGLQGEAPAALSRHIGAHNPSAKLSCPRGGECAHTGGCPDAPDSG